jgi:hypothetical protein
MLFLISDLIESLMTTVNRALERFFSGVSPQVIEQPLRFFEEFATAWMIARVHSRLPLSVREGITQEFELAEEARGREGEFFFET